MSGGPLHRGVAGVSEAMRLFIAGESEPDLFELLELPDLFELLELERLRLRLLLFFFGEGVEA